MFEPVVKTVQRIGRSSDYDSYLISTHNMQYETVQTDIYFILYLKEPSHSKNFTRYRIICDHLCPYRICSVVRRRNTMVLKFIFDTYIQVIEFLRSWIKTCNIIYNVHDLYECLKIKEFVKVIV